MLVFTINRNIKKVLFLVAFSLILVGKPADSLSQLAGNFEIGANLMGSVIIDVESGIDVTFIDEEVNEVSVLDNFNAGDGSKQAALIRITGAPAEAMIDIESLSLKKVDDDGNELLSVYDFNLVSEGAGAAVTIMPYSDDLSYLMAIGGTIKAAPNPGTIYRAVNVVNINYL